VRSINTSVTALLPVAALLLVGVAVLGTGPLKDLALALFVGMLAGTYSSIFIATPFAAQLKDREPAIKAHTDRVLARRDAEPVAATVVVKPNRTVAPTGASKRAQPSRTPRSKRGKRGS
jgi:preprotein translocase subunit SecF